MGNKNNRMAKSVADQLPQWDLSVFFSGIDDPAIDETLLQLKAGVKQLAEDKDKLAKFEDYELLEYIRLFEGIVIAVRDLHNFAHLNACTQNDNQEAVAFEMKIYEEISEIMAKLAFIHYEMFKLPAEKKVEFYLSEKLKDYEGWLLVNLFAPPFKNEDVSMIIQQLSQVISCWPMKYNTFCSKMNFVMEEKKYSLSEIENIANLDPDPEVRRKAQHIISEEFARNGYLFTTMLNTIFKDEAVTAKIYQNDSFDGALEMDAIRNGMLKEDVLAVAAAVTDTYVSVSQRFYKLSAKLLKKDRLEYVDRVINPIETDSKKKYSWKECLDLVYAAFATFGLDACAKSVVDNRWVDAKPAIGKRAGAFSIQGDKPFVLLNFMGDANSVNTFAHEMGHAVHHLLSASRVNVLCDDTTIGMSEVASEFAEGLLFAKLFAQAETNKERLSLLFDCVYGQINAIHRQIAFSKFEERIYRERKKGELSEERITQIYCEEMERYLGFPLEEDAKNSWMRVGHFFGMPFYVRYYAFSGCVVNQLQKAYNSGEVENFVGRYVDMLRNTGIEDYRDLLRPFKLNPDKADFWFEAIDVISARIDMIEDLAKKEGLL